MPYRVVSPIDHPPDAVPPVEAATVLALGRIEGGRFIPEEIGYWRMVTTDEGIMCSIAPVGEDDEADTIAGPRHMTSLEGVAKCVVSRSRILRRLFGTPAKPAPPAESIGDLLAGTHDGPP